MNEADRETLYEAQWRESVPKFLDLLHWPQDIRVREWPEEVGA